MTHFRENTSGMALVTALIFISVAALMLGALLIRNTGQARNVERYEDYTSVINGVEAGIASSVAELYHGGDGIVGLDSLTPAYNEYNEFVWPAPDDASIAYKSMKTNANLKYCSYAVDWYTDGRDSNGDGLVDSQNEKDIYSIYSMATLDGTTRKVEAVYSADNINVWENAIFAGSGQAGGLINGNVSIHGSVHLLGNALPQGQTAIAALELSGTSLIHNNYDGLVASLRARVPALPQTMFEGETIDTLDATLRVKHGLVGLSGNSEIGQPQQTGNTFKETMDGTYVTDGWTGNAVTPDGDRGDPTSVWSDNAWDNTYELGDKVPFPLLNSEWREPDDGSMIQNPDTGTWYTHEDYFNQVLLADPTVKDDGIYNGNISLAVNGTSFYWNATTNTKLTGAAADLAMPAATDDYIQFRIVGNDAILKMNGQIRINGSLSFTGQGNKRTVHYSGRAAILAYGNITIDTNLLTCNNGVPIDTINSFPVRNALGLMASQDMYVGTTSQLQIMGAFYAQNKIVSAKQTTVMGTFVANYFDMGTNVPDIYQVPALADNLPLGMIGNYPILALTAVSWREIH